MTQSQADAIAAAGKRGMRDLVRDGTIDRDDLQALKAALQDYRAENRDAKKAEREAARDAVLAGLVSDGTLTQSQADAIATAIDARIAEKGDQRGNKGKRGPARRTEWIRRRSERRCHDLRSPRLAPTATPRRAHAVLAGGRRRRS